MSRKRVAATIEEPQAHPTMSLDELIADLKGFGIEDTTDPIKIYASGKKVEIKMANIPNEQELEVLFATEEFKGHAFVARVKCEILARAISWINGQKIESDAWVVDPTTGQESTIRVALRNLLLGWGQETVNVLWKTLMVHCQRIEDRLIEALPDAAIMTEMETRYLQQAVQEMAITEREAIKGSFESAVSSIEE